MHCDDNQKDFSGNHAVADSLAATAALACAVVEGDNRDHGVGQTDDRHDCEALQLVVNTKYCGCSGSEAHQNHVPLPCS